MHHTKRRHYSTTPHSSSSDASDSEQSLGPHHRRKRRLISSDEEGHPSSSDGMTSFRAQMKKRNHDDVYSEEDEEDILTHQPTSSFRSSLHHSLPPATKRLRRGLSDGFTKLGIREQAQGVEGGANGVVEPSSVEVPGEGEIGPAVWVRHADPVDDDGEEDKRVKYVVVGEDGQEEELSGKEVALWRGKRITDGENEVYIPSYLHSCSSPSTRALPPPDDAWNNRERGLVLYAPKPPPYTSITPPTITEIDLAPTSPMDTTASTPTMEESPMAPWSSTFGEENPAFGFDGANVPNGAGAAYVEEIEGGEMDMD